MSGVHAINPLGRWVDTTNNEGWVTHHSQKDSCFSLFLTKTLLYEIKSVTVFDLYIFQSAQLSVAETILNIQSVSRTFGNLINMLLYLGGKNTMKKQVIAFLSGIALTVCVSTTIHQPGRMVKVQTFYSDDKVQRYIETMSVDGWRLISLSPYARGGNSASSFMVVMERNQ